uniref:Uncharacterized LOC101243110 n=1 Tax=Ciona intestinalis TaxID=7719 RepID=H2Y043_CIOIN
MSDQDKENEVKPQDEVEEPKNDSQESVNDVYEVPIRTGLDNVSLEIEDASKTIDPKPVQFEKVPTNQKPEQPSQSEIVKQNPIVKTRPPPPEPYASLPKRKPGGTMTSPPTYVSNEPTFSYSRRTFMNFVKSFEGVLFIVEVIASLLSWVLLTVWTRAGPDYRFPVLLASRCLLSWLRGH